MTPERLPGTVLAGPDRTGEADQSPRPLAPPRPRLGPEEWRATQEIAAQLGETERGPRGQVGRVVGRLGPDRARAFLTRTQEIEAAGGLMLPDGSRRRSPGGVFFHLVRTDDNLSREDRTYIFPSQFGRNGRGKGAGGDTQPTPMPAPAVAPAPQPTTWADDDYRRAMAVLQQDRGRTSTVKITVIGRPGAAVEQGQAVVLALVNEKTPDLPKGLPEPPAGTRYTVFVARKQGGKIAEVLAADAEDAAIIEGIAAPEQPMGPGADGRASVGPGTGGLHGAVMTKASSSTSRPRCVPPLPPFPSAPGLPLHSLLYMP